MVPHVTLLTLGVSEMADSVAFYRDGLGLPMRERADVLREAETAVLVGADHSLSSTVTTRGFSPEGATTVKAASAGETIRSPRVS